MLVVLSFKMQKPPPNRDPNYNDPREAPASTIAPHFIREILYKVALRARRFETNALNINGATFHHYILLTPCHTG